MKTMSDGMSSAVRVMLVEDHELLAESLRLVLTAEGMQVSVPELKVEQILATAAAEKPDVVLLDLDLGLEDVDGSVLIQPLSGGGARVVVLSGTSDRLRLAVCVERGAYGFTPKSRPLDELVASVRAAAAGDPILSDNDRQEILAELRASRRERSREMAPFEALTARERFVLAKVMDGVPAADIATASFVSEATVRTQIRAVLTKLGVRSQLAAVAEAARVGWRYDEPTPS